MLINQNITSRGLLNATVAAVVALAGLFVSCARIEDSGDALACLTFSSISVDYSVENLPATKAVLPEIELPEAEDFTVRITGGKGDPLVFAPGEIPDKVLLDAGTYTVEAFYGENLFGRPYFHKSVEVSLLPQDSKRISLTGVALANSMVAVTLPADFKDHMDVSSIDLSDSKGGSLNNIAAGQYVYAPSGSEVYVTFNGTNSAGQVKSIKVTLGTLWPQHAYDVVCNLDLPTLTFADQSSGAWAGRLYLTSLATSDKAVDMSAVDYMASSDGGSSWSEVYPLEKTGYWVIEGLDKDKTYSIKAVLGEIVSNSWSFTPSESSTVTIGLQHTYDSGILTGTKATVGGDIPYPSILSGLIQTKGSYGAELVDAGGNVVRTLSSKTGEMSVANDWPYLPQGTYALKPYYQIGSEKIYASNHASGTAGKPSVALNVSAYTSYDWYSQGNIDNANVLENRLKVMSRKVTLGISDEILQNTKYSSLLTSSVTYPNESLSAFSVSSTSSNTITYNDVTYTDAQLGSYTFSASVTFDGVTASDSHDCWITGLPYSVDFGNSKEWYGWTSNGAAWVNTTVNKLRFNSGFIVSPKFAVPGDIKVTVPAKVQYYYWNSTISKRTATFSLGATGSTSAKATNVGTADVKSDVYTTNRSNDVSFQTTLTASLPYISIASNQNDTYIYSLAINYRY